MRKSAKKKQSQVQTIQRRVASRNVTQDNDNNKEILKRQSLVLPSMPEEL